MHERILQGRLDSFHFIGAGDTVVVEGTTEGELLDVWRLRGGSTPGGRFCSVFDLRDGRVARMHICLDPDYAGQDTARIMWGGARAW